MTAPVRPLAEVTHAAIRLLARELGVVDTARFWSQVGAGRGDYTEERRELFEGITLEEWVEAARHVDAERERGETLPDRPTS